MRAPDTSPGDVSGPEQDRFAVERRLGLPFQEVVRLLERVIMRTGCTIGVVLHHEHRRQLGAQIGVDHHLHVDSSVDEQRRAHARGHLEQVLALPAGVHL
jgi:hypothetical protein